MGFMKRAIEEMQERGWTVSNENLQRLIDVRKKEKEKSIEKETEGETQDVAPEDV